MFRRGLRYKDMIDLTGFALLSYTARFVPQMSYNRIYRLCKNERVDSYPMVISEPSYSIGSATYLCILR